jgi:5-hydroxyisourate hydrolase-like protein (transthyretin family)
MKRLAFLIGFVILMLSGSARAERQPSKLNTDKAEYAAYKGQSISVLATLSDKKTGKPLAKRTIKLILGSTVLQTKETNNNGRCRFNIALNQEGRFTYELLFRAPASDSHLSAKTYFTAVCSRVPTTLTGTQQYLSWVRLTNPQEQEGVSITGTLYDATNNQPLASRNLQVLDAAGVLMGTGTTDSQGVVAIQVLFPKTGTQQYTLLFVPSAEDAYAGCQLAITMEVHFALVDVSLHSGSLRRGGGYYDNARLAVHVQEVDANGTFVGFPPATSAWARVRPTSYNRRWSGYSAEFKEYNGAGTYTSPTFSYPSTVKGINVEYVGGWYAPNGRMLLSKQRNRNL